MCIIVAKKSGVEMPSLETLSRCFDANPNGAGIMIAAKKRVFGFKGLMSFTEFVSELDTVRNRFGDLDKLPIVMHFRISTHGKTCPANTHPFPIKASYREMRKVEWEADQGFAHNGIIFTTSIDTDVTKFNVSDTMVFCKKYLAPLAKYCDIASDKDILDIAYEVANSKLCFLNKKGIIATRGNFIEDNGVLYSNDSFQDKPKAKVVSKYSCKTGYYAPYSSYDRYDDYPYNEGIRLSKYDLDAEMDFEASENGLERLSDDFFLKFNKSSEQLDDYYAIDTIGSIYYFNEEMLRYYLYATADEYVSLVSVDELFKNANTMSEPKGVVI